MKRLLERALRLLGSWRLATLLVVAWAALVVVWIIPFEFYGLPGAQLKAIVYREFFFRALYAALAVSTIACMALRVTPVLRRMSRRPSEQAVPKLPSDARVAMGAYESGRAEAVLASMGFRDQVRGAGWVWGVRNRWSPVGTLLLHAAVLVLMTAGLVAVFGAPQFSGEAVVAPGERFDSKADQWASIDTTGAQPPELAFTMRQVNASFYRDILLFTDLEAVLDDESGRPRSMTLASPWVRWPDGLVAIKDFGYSADVVVSTATTTSPVRTYKLKVFPSEITDTFDVKVGLKDYRIYLRVYGDYVDKSGTPGNRSFNLVNPRIVAQAKEVLSSGTEVDRGSEVLIAPGEPIEVPGGRIVIEQLQRHAVLRITRVPAAPWILLAVVMASVGAWIRLVTPRQEATISSTDGAEVSLAVLDDTYRRARDREDELVRRWGGQQ